MTSQTAVRRERRPSKQLGLWRVSEEPFHLSDRIEQQLMRLLAELLLGAVRRLDSSADERQEESEDE
jgi:hypothetical protein